MYKIVLGTTLGINPFHKFTPAEIRHVCIRNHERLAVPYDASQRADNPAATQR